MNKSLRFGWRFFRNIACMFAPTRRLLYPAKMLADRFGRSDAQYAWRVFWHHNIRLREAGFSSANRILEVGPGRNLGTTLLWWAWCSVEQNLKVEIVCWDIYRNIDPERNGFWSALAKELIAEENNLQKQAPLHFDLSPLHEVADGLLNPSICYWIFPLGHFESKISKKTDCFDLIYSHAAIEHIWHIDKFWVTIVDITQQGGWHSHRIDLSDHGRRDTNYLEMLEWSRISYWSTMRFVPGAINRWRAGKHLNKMKGLGLKVLHECRTMRDGLPIPRHRLSSEFIALDDDELRTTALDVVARKIGL